MMIRIPVAAAILLLLSVAPASPGAEDPPPKRIPLPVNKSQRLIQEGPVFTVEGRVRIPKSFKAPADPKRDDAVVLDKCWFEGVTDPKAIAERIRDSADDPANNVRASALNPQERPLELVGGVNR